MWRPGHAQVGAGEFAVAHELADDLAGVGVDGYGKAETHPRHGGVDTDDLGATVRERPARIPGVQRSVGLDDVGDDACRGTGAGGQRPTEPGDDTCGD
jgi:hypothetical protein